MFEFSSQQLQSVHPFLQSELIVRICQSLMKESIDFATAQEIITLFNSPLEHGKDTRIVKIAKYWEVVVLSSHHISFRRCEELDATANTNLVNPMKSKMLMIILIILIIMMMMMLITQCSWKSST